jgi:tetraacyldisaccharide 4'-kinase
MRPVGEGGREPAVLAPFSWIYRAGVRVHRWVGLRRRTRAPARPRIVSVGNLETGGSGKTPLSILLLERAVSRGQRAAYVSRGYRSVAERGPLVTVVAGACEQRPPLPGTRVVARDHPLLECEVGDEGALVADRVPWASLFISHDKPGALRVALEWGADTIVLDDAFQSWALPRHVDVVCVDVETPSSPGRVLPAGRLREPPVALARADAVVVSGVQDGAALGRARNELGRWLRPGARVAGLSRRAVLVPARAQGSTPPARVLAVSGIARPRRFEESLRTAGLVCLSHEVFRDHHRYDERDAAAIAARVRETGAEAVVTTEKDWVKLRRLAIGAPVWLARLEVELFGDELPS